MDKSQAIKVLENEREQLLEQLKSLDLTILTLKKSLNMPDFSGNGKNGYQNNGSISYSSPVLKYSGYDKAKSNKEKAAIILRQEGRFLHMRQIKAIAVSLERNESAESVEKKIGQAIYTLKSEDSIIDKKIGDSNMNVFWGSKTWLNEDGTIKEAHKYDEDELVGKKKQKVEI